VRVKHGDDEATATVAVSADPRFDIPLADMQEKHRLMLAFGTQAEVGTEAVERIESTTKASKALADAGKELKKTLEALEEQFRGRQDVQGIRRDPNTVQSRLSAGYRSMGSSWEKPTEAEFLALEQGRAVLAAFLEEFNRVFAEDVAAFREMVQAAELELLPEKEPLSLDWTRKGR
jgi:hypothetical protein